MAFYYYTNEIVRKGDVIETGNRHAESPVVGTVVNVIEPGSDDSVTYQCPDGGVLVEENWGGTPSLLLLTPPDRENWEDVKLIKAASLES